MNIRGGKPLWEDALAHLVETSKRDDDQVTFAWWYLIILYSRQD